MGSVERAEALLDSALSRANGQPLAYDPNYLYDLRQQVIDFIETYPKTIPLKIGSYTSNDGTEHRMLMLDGVVPMHYKSEKYNLPLAIWLPLKFPLAAPVAYVKRSSGQFIFNPRCAVVDAAQDGRIVSDYVKAWAFPGSNLADFVGDLRVHFAEMPPLYQSPSPGAAAPAAAAPPPSSGPAVTGFNPLSPAGSAAAATAAAAVAAAPSLWGNLLASQQPAPAAAPPGRPQQPAPAPAPAAGVSPWHGALAAAAAAESAAAAAQRQQAAVQQRAAAYHLALTTALSSRLASALDAAASAGKQRQAGVQAELRARGASLAAEVARLQREREALDGAAHELAAAAAALDGWLAVNEPRAAAAAAAAAGEIDPDAAIVPADALSGQALDAQAADLALEDTLAALDRAFEGKRLALGDYLAAVRATARKQFTARALSSKIASRQAAAAAARPRPAAARAAAAAAQPAEQPAQLPIGDVWHTSGGILLNPLAAAARNMSIR